MEYPVKPSKLPEVGTTIFTVMSQLALQHQAINLGQGFPDFAMNERLIHFVSEAMEQGQNQYTHMNGLPLLRERIRDKVKRLYHADINADTQITVTPGATYAIYTALTSILQPGDEVIVFEPAYDSYIPNIVINGAKPVLIPLAVSIVYHRLGRSKKQDYQKNKRYHYQLAAQPYRHGVAQERYAAIAVHCERYQYCCDKR